MTDGSRPGHIEFTYHIDSGDLITAVDEEWLRFAEENGATELTRQNVEGRSLWDFVEGNETAQLYKILFEKIRGTDRTCDIPFRCDAPTLRRFMRLIVSSDEQHNIHFTSVLIREEPRDHQGLLVPAEDADEVMVKMCSWCKRVALPEGRWLEVEEAMISLRIFETSTHPVVTHGLCQDCRDSMLDQWEKDKHV